MEYRRKKLIKIIPVLVLISIFIIIYIGKPEHAYGVQTVTIATVENGPLNMRKAPAIESGNIIVQIPTGSKVELLNKYSNEWYYVLYNGQKGYVYAQYISVKTINVNDDKGFEEYMSAQGFSEGYKSSLRMLHAMFPNWVFKADLTGLDWNYVIDKENEYRGNKKINVVPEYTNENWKSDPIPNEGTYDYGWVGASRSAIEHFMDPRNFLTEHSIFQFISNKYEPSIHNKAGVEAIVRNSFLDGAFPEAGYARYSDVIMEAARQSGVSPYALASMIMLEQGRSGSSGSISGKVSGYEGIYNFFNIGAYDGANAVLNGLNYAKNSGWNSRTKAIIEGAKWFGRNYVHDNQYTPYLKKFNVMNGAENVGYHQYMTNVMGANSEGQGEYNAYSSILDQALVFLIPVFNNMPGDDIFKLDTGNRKIQIGERFGFLAMTGDKSRGNVQIKSSNPDVVVAELKNAGDNRGFYFEATGLKGGKSVLTVTYGGITRSFEVSVFDFRLDTGDRIIEVGQRFGFLAMTDDKSYGNVTISSDKPDIVKAELKNDKDTRGFYFEATGIKEGTAVITVNYGNRKKDFKVTVNGGKDEADYHLDTGDRNISVNQSFGFLALTQDKSFGDIQIRSERPEIVKAELKNAKDTRGFYFEVTGLKEGSSNIIVTYGGVEKRFKVNVINYRLDTGNRNIESGQSFGFLALTSNKSYGNISVISSNNNVVRVELKNAKDTRGFYFEATGINPGSAVVTVQYGGVEKSFNVNVKKTDNIVIPKVPDYRIDTGNRRISSGESFGFLAVTEDKSFGNIKISSDNPDIVRAELKNAKDSRGFYFEATGLRNGTATITVSYGGVNKSFSVTVEAPYTPNVPNYRLDTGNRVISKNQSFGFLAMTDDKRYGNIHIKSSNPDILTAELKNARDSRGFYFEATGKQSGKAIITVEYGGVEKSFEVTVQ